MRFDDYQSVRALLLDHSLESPPFEHWRHRWVDNPLWQRLGATAPIGWVLETATGEIVGSMESIPTGYTFRGTDLVACAGAGLCVRASHRRYALQLLDEFSSQPVDLFVGTTVGPSAVSTLSRFYVPVPVGRWDTMSYFVTGHVSFAKRALQKYHVRPAGLLAYPAGWALLIKDVLCNTTLPQSPRDVLIEGADTFDNRFDAFWNQLVLENQEKLLAERNSRALRWHFDAAIRSGRLWIFTASENGRLRGYCVFRQELSPGGRCICLIDYQTLDRDRDLLPAFLRAALRRCAAEGFYILQNVGVGVPKMSAFEQYAPYRRKLPNSVFFYGAADAALEAELRDPQCWDPSLFDGDATL
jgi:hypothetical protein